MEKYKRNIRRIVESRIRKQSNETSEDDLHERLYKRILKVNNTAQQIEDFSEAMRLACEQSFKTTKDTETQISSLVDTGNHSNAENHKCFKEKIPKNKRQSRTKRKNDILRPKIKIRSNNKKR